jgi:hypothetical protein
LHRQRGKAGKAIWPPPEGIRQRIVGTPGGFDGSAGIGDCLDGRGIQREDRPDDAVAIHLGETAVTKVEQLVLKIAPGAGNGVLLGVAERLLEREVLLERDLVQT